MNPAEFDLPFDLAIIGGGINGAAIARDAALRGLKVILLEKSDFGSGASSKTSKLAHGGIRYLEKLQFGLVRESLKERELLLKNAPHLVRPLPFILPVYSRDPYPIWKINIGLYLYDFLAGSTALPKHRKISKDAIALSFPKITSEGMQGGCLYWDAQMDDSRLVIENLLAAQNAGAVLLNYAPVTGLSKSNGCINGLYFKDPVSKKIKKILSQVVVNATGPWSNQITEMEPGAVHCQIAPTKGVHLVLPQINKEQALILRAPQDGRIFFIIPWENESLVGTTDTFYNNDPDKISVDEQDIEYLLKAVNFYFPNLNLTHKSIIATFAGLRPLIAPEKHYKPSEVARGHCIHTSSGGLITVLGGKYTAFRKIAEEVVDRAIQQLKINVTLIQCQTESRALPGASGVYSFEEVKNILRNYGLNENQIDHLVRNYGQRSLDILKIMQRNPREAQPICPLHPHLLAEITHSIEVEYAKTLSDWFLRRTSIGYSPCRGLNCLEKTAQKFKEILKWDDNTLKSAIKEYQTAFSSADTI